MLQMKIMQKIHCIGIGGIGISALARYFFSQGYTVSGSDAVETDLTEELRNEGIKISIGERVGNVPTDASLVIYSPAVPKTHAELRAAHEYGIETKSYPQALGELTKEFTTIAVSGSHGKSTTTSLIALLLIAAKLDPTVIVGTKLSEFKGKNFRAGNSQYLVLEADEWNRSFHYYSPKIIVLTNIDKEHLDTYKTYAGVLKGFRDYVGHLKENGVLIANFKDPGVRKIGEEFLKKGRKVIWYNKTAKKPYALGIPGAHNQVNADAAAAVGEILGISKLTRDHVFASFKGAWRRMERLKVRGRMVYSDYGHHPTEIKATLEALKSAHPKTNLICVFEPHQRDRLSRLFKDFIYAFDKANLVILLPIYAVSGREHTPTKNEKDSFALAQAIRAHKKGSFYAMNIPGAMKIISKFDAETSVIVFMGAGDIDANVRKYFSSNIKKS